MNAQDLKNSILQLAIQGKLVEQRKEEGTAKELLEQIKTNKEKLIREGKLKKEKPLAEITEDEISFDIPDSWIWVRIGTICNVINGFTPKRDNSEYWTGGNIPWFTIADIRNQGRFITKTEQYITKKALSQDSDRIIPKDSVLICCTASVGECAYTGIELTTNQQFNGMVIKEIYKKTIYTSYLFEFSKTLKRKLLESAGKTTINFVSVKKLMDIIVPLPPLEEQKRIVAKIEELMPYIEKYGEAHSKLEEFNKKFPEDMQKSILQYTIQGKLVEQRAEEGTAEELYQQIQEEKARLIKEGKIKKGKSLAEITEEEIPFEIPDSWKWVRIGEIFNLQAGKNITSSDIFDNHSEVNKYPCYGGNGLRGYVKTFNRDGKYALIGRQGALCGNINYAQDKFYATEHAVVVDHFGLTDVMWCGYFLTALNLNQYATATAQPGLAVSNIVKVLIPLPPRQEQNRIVAKIEEMISCCQQLVK